MNLPTAASRRSLLKFGAAALAGAALPGAAKTLFATDAAGATAAGEAFGGLTMGIQSYTLRDRPFQDMLKALKELGITQVELFPNHLAGRSPQDALQLMKDHGVTAVSYGVVPLGSNADENRKMFEIAKTYGMKNLSCDPAPDAFDSLDKLTEEYKVTVAIHPHGPGHRWAKVETIQNAIKDHSKMIGLCADTGHLIRAAEDPVRACEVFKDRLWALHVKDFKKNDKGDFHDVPAGEGELQVDALVKLLIDLKYQGVIAIEYEGGQPVEATRKSLERIKEAARKAKGA